MNSSNLKILLAYLGLSFLWLLPATLRPFTVLPSGPYSDSSQALWAVRNFQWFGSRFSDLSYPPRGVSYEYIDWIAVPNTLVQPLSSLFGPFFAYNLLIWLSLGLTAFFAYHLALLFGAEKWGALLGGVGFGFCPAMAGQIVLGHFYFVLGSVLIAPYLYALLQCLRAEKPVNWGVTALILWGLLLRTCHYYALFLIPIAIILAIWDIWVHRKGSLRTALGLLLAGVFISIVAILPGVIGTSSEIDFTLQRVNVEFYDADLYGLVTPSPYHPIWGSQFSRSGDRVVFSGFTLLLLACWAFRKSPKILLSLWLFASVMSLGPTLFVGGERVMNLPWAKLFELPAYSEIQVYARAGLLAQLFLALWVACAVKGRKTAVVAASFLAFEFLLVPVPTMTSEFTEILIQLRDRKMGTVLYLPYEGANTEPLYYHMIHQKGLLRSPVLRPSDELIRFYEALPWVAALTDKDGYEKAPSVEPERLIRLTDLRFLLLDKRRLSEQQLAEWRRFLPHHFPVEETLENDGFLIYVLSDLRPSLLSTDLAFDENDRGACFWGWSKPKIHLGRKVREIKGSESKIWMPLGKQQDYRLQLTSITTESDSALVLWNGKLLGPLIGGREWAKSEFEISAAHVKEGANLLEIVPARHSQVKWYLDGLTLTGL